MKINYLDNQILNVNAYRSNASVRNDMQMHNKPHLYVIKRNIAWMTLIVLCMIVRLKLCIKSM